jgi:acyl-CoA thioester hydrolase
MHPFTYSTEISVRFQDIDLFDHVNNVAYAAYLEEARIQFFEDAVGVVLGESDDGFALVHLEVEYERQIEYGDSVEVLLRVLELGSSSIAMDYQVRADGRVAATAETVVVPFDGATGESFPIPDAWRESLAEYENTPE